MAALLQEDVNWLLRKMPPALRAICEADSRSHRIIIAGGFIRAVIAGEEVHDVDVFVGENVNVDYLSTELRRQAGVNDAIVSTPNAVTIRTSPAIQIITRWRFANIVDCVESFDFTIARAALQFDNERWMSFCDERFYPDLAARRLRYCSPDRREDEGGSMLRLLKFYSRGYRAPLGAIGAVMARAIKGVHDGVPHTGTEAEVASAIIKRLRVVDPAADPEDEGHLG